MTVFTPKWWLSGLSVGVPILTRPALTSIDSPRRGGPVGIVTSLFNLRTTTIFMDQISGELIDFILFYHPPGIISAHSVGGLTHSLRVAHYLLKPSPRLSWPCHAFRYAPLATELISDWTKYLCSIIIQDDIVLDGLMCRPVCVAGGIEQIWQWGKG